VLIRVFVTFSEIRLCFSLKQAGRSNALMSLTVPRILSPFAMWHYLITRT